ncbi:MAG: hypothetical protein COV79_05305 [Parcubacteria group bacterium CG11_big_fil_rev_8_21_14_0_20_41_14]|nr:MAG: hypothetical protein COV79_05305 [Parcubacteria group bacterium CG11_big_fil_rev_8_21_14_0_20_41_14]PIR56688.1 MAG: hypothetical protein COU72_04945 [Parcubacteria group bacterium CG10_big_fil_rev_8_21_14_0_10_41_35]
MNQDNTTLLFVYNADGTFFASVTDYAHKIVSPETYQCNLCKLTYGNAGMKKEWQIFLETLPYKKEFQHRDEFLRIHPEFADTPLPAIFFLSGKNLYILLEGSVIEKASSLDQLQDMLTKGLEKYRTEST